MHDYPRRPLQPTSLHDGNLPLETYLAIISSRAAQRLQCQETLADFESDGELDWEEEESAPAELDDDDDNDENSAHGPAARRDVARDRLLL